MPVRPGRSVLCYCRRSCHWLVCSSLPSCSSFQVCSWLTCEVLSYSCSWYSSCYCYVTHMLLILFVFLPWLTYPSPYVTLSLSLSLSRSLSLSLSLDFFMCSILNYYNNQRCLAPIQAQFPLPPEFQCFQKYMDNMGLDCIALIAGLAQAGSVPLSTFCDGDLSICIDKGVSNKLYPHDINVSG